MAISKDRIDYFTQPSEGFTIVSHSAEPSTILTDEAIEKAKDRVAEGEDIEAVALDLVTQEIELRGVPSDSALRTAAQKDNTPLHKAADRHIAPIRAVVTAAFDAGRRAYRSGGAPGAGKAVHDSLAKSLPSVLSAALEDGGNVAIEALPARRAAEMVAILAGKKTFEMRFDVYDSDAAEWAREHAAELAKGLSASVEERIKDAIANEAETGEDAYDDILDAIGDEDRAEMIARTESMDAANEGLAQGWAQAEEEGLLTGNELKEWIATPGCCDECDEVDGEQVGMNEDFSVGDDPPLHPNCRCTMGLADA